MKFIQNEIGSLYHSVISKDVEYTVYKDIIIQYFNNNLKAAILQLKQYSIFDKSISEFLPGDEKFGELFYQKIVNNVKTSNVPIHSLHDFFWWTIFSGRYLFCALRAPVAYSLGSNKQSLINDCLIQWFNNDQYQLWSMNNNNNGEKIAGPTQGLYKIACKKYIFEFDRNEWYFHHKMKIVSSPNIIRRNWKKHFNEFDTVLGVDENYNMINIGTPEVDNYVTNRLMQYKIDWC